MHWMVCEQTPTYVLVEHGETQPNTRTQTHRELHLNLVNKWPPNHQHHTLVWCSNDAIIPQTSGRVARECVCVWGSITIHCKVHYISFHFFIYIFIYFYTVIYLEKLTEVIWFFKIKHHADNSASKIKKQTQKTEFNTICLLLVVKRSKDSVFFLFMAMVLISSIVLNHEM